MADHYVPKVPSDWIIERIRNHLLVKANGEIVWAKNVSSNARLGQKAGCVCGHGYVYLSFQRGNEQRRIAAHHVVWFVRTGHWPTQEIDHINGNPLDNRFENLRLSDRKQQSWNRVVKPNKIGLAGVERINGGRYRARMRVNEKQISLGIYDTPEEAHAAYVDGLKRHRNCLPRQSENEAA